MQRWYLKLKHKTAINDLHRPFLCEQDDAKIWFKVNRQRSLLAYTSRIWREHYQRVMFETH